MDEHRLVHTRHPPAHLDTSRGAHDSLRGAQQSGPVGAEPARQQPAYTRIEEGRRFGPLCQWKTVFSVERANQVCADCLGSIGGRSARLIGLHQGVGSELAAAQAADELVAGKLASVQGQLAAKARNNGDVAAEGPSVAAVLLAEPRASGIQIWRERVWHDPRIFRRGE